jgi:hypothetical protein
MEQLLFLLNAGFAPNDGIGVIDNLAQKAKIDRVVEIVRALVRQPEDEEPTLFLIDIKSEHVTDTVRLEGVAEPGRSPATTLSFASPG